MWVKDENGDSYYMEKVEDICVIKIERWEHGYYVEVEDKDTEQVVILKYFYYFQDARAFLTSLSRLIRSSV